MRQLSLNPTSILLDSVPVSGLAQPLKADEIYRRLSPGYPKFFKMDTLSRWAFIGAELLCSHGADAVYREVPAAETAVVLATGNGCLEVDHQFRQSMETVASPGLFVYTLPNIMLGELSIRHGFKGEQLCLVQDGFDAAEISFACQELLQHRGMTACLCGWVDVSDGRPDVRLWWLTIDDLPFMLPE